MFTLNLVTRQNVSFLFKRVLIFSVEKSVKNACHDYRFEKQPLLSTYYSEYIDFIMF